MKTQRSLRPLFTVLTLAAAAPLAWSQSTPPNAGTPPTPAAAESTSRPAEPAATPGAQPAAPAAANATPAAAPAAGGARPLLPSVDTSTPVGGTVAGSLDSPGAVPAIQRQEFETRDQLLTELRARIDKADKSLADLEQRNGSVEADAKKTLDTAVADYNRAKERLQQRFEAAQKADAATWERARSALATEFAFFVSATASVEVAAPNP